jgi:hypothetical protein
MAITNTRTVQRLEVYPGEEPRIMVVYEHTFDDTEDAELPVVTTKVKHLEKFQPAAAPMEGEEAAEPELTDVSGEDPLVQTVANAVWAEGE